MCTLHTGLKYSSCLLPRAASPPRRYASGKSFAGVSFGSRRDREGGVWEEGGYNAQDDDELWARMQEMLGATWNIRRVRPAGRLENPGQLAHIAPALCPCSCAHQLHPSPRPLPDALCTCSLTCLPHALLPYPWSFAHVPGGQA